MKDTSEGGNYISYEWTTRETKSVDGLNQKTILVNTEANRRIKIFVFKQY